jgi:competence protein ComEC
MALGVLVMVLAAFDCVFFYPLKALEWSIMILNKTINWVASFERFVIKDIAFNYYMLICVYLLIISIVLWFKKPNYLRLAVAMISIILFQSSYYGTLWNKEPQKQLIVFNSKRSTIIGLRSGKDMTLFSNDSIQKNAMIKSYMLANFSSIKDLKRLKNMIYYKGKRILVLDSLGICPSNIRPDIILITKSPKISLERIFHGFRPELVIIGSSNYKTYIKNWKETCVKEKIPFHIISEKGSYKL